MNPTVALEQAAPWPESLATLLDELDYLARDGWRVWLDPHTDRGQGSIGMTLIVQRCGPDTYHPEERIRVNHYFPVPPAAYDRRSWQRWLFDRLGDVDTHERMENFIVGGVRPYAPSHGPGNDPYLVRETGSELDAATSFRGDVDPAFQERLDAIASRAGSHKDGPITGYQICGRVYHPDDVEIIRGGVARREANQ